MKSYEILCNHSKRWLSVASPRSLRRSSRGRLSEAWRAAFLDSLAARRVSEAIAAAAGAVSQIPCGDRGLRRVRRVTCAKGEREEGGCAQEYSPPGHSCCEAGEGGKGAAEALLRDVTRHLCKKRKDSWKLNMLLDLDMQVFEARCMRWGLVSNRL